MRPAVAGHWAVLCHRPGPTMVAYFVDDQPLLLARAGTAFRADASLVVRAAIVEADDALVLGLLRDDAVTLVESVDADGDPGLVVVPGRYWDIVLA